MKKNQAQLLLQKYLAGNCTEHEKALLESWYLNQNLDSLPDLNNTEREKDLAEVFAKLESEYTKPKQTLMWPRMVAAAMILLTLSVGLYFYIVKVNPNTPNSAIGKEYASKIKPGGNKAVLILEDGKEISLDEAKVGDLATQSGITISKTSDGKIIYTVRGDLKGSQTGGFNTIKTPRGGQYQVNLPDGTKVWLNASSFIRYPTAFAQNKREVELSGEAYFEVAKDKTRPFKVISEKQVVEVLGTHFNINSYQDEASTKTTLMEGSVRITAIKTDKKIMLVPGNQSIITQEKTDIINGNLEEAISWKNGQFMFVNENLGSIMRKLARWYNIEVNYEDAVANKTFSGTISRYTDVTEVLKTLELTKSVKFKIEGNTITALKTIN